MISLTVGQLAEHTFPFAGIGNAEGFGDGGGNIRKRPAHAEIDRKNIPAVCDQRNVFPRVVGACVGRVTAVVGGEKQQTAD